MKWYELLKFSARNLWRRKLRTALTVLGVMIGTASIVVMMSLGIGLSYSTMQQLEESSTLTLITVYNYGGGYYMEGNGYVEDQTAVLDRDAVDSFAALEHVKVASPVYEFPVIAQSGKYRGDLYVNAISLDMMYALNLPVLKGQLPQEGDPLQFVAGRQVGYNFYDPSSSMYYYGDEQEGPPVDMYEDQLFVVFDTEAYYMSQSGEGAAPKKHIVTTAALLGEENEQGWSQYDYNLYADLAAVEAQFQKTFKKGPWPNQQTDKNGKPVTPMTYNTAYVLVDNMDNVAAVQQQITDMGFQAYSDMDYLNAMQEQSKIIQYVLAGIGSVSLLVAAIGIANTMLMSIFERTKEIGIFKVLGCSLGNIRTMFLMEAGLIGLVGGVFGLGVSYGLSALVNLILGGGQAISVIPLWLAALGLGFSALVGMIAGLSPAIRATKLSPLEAIRSL